MNLSMALVKRLEQIQAKLLKSSLGLHKFCKSYPLLSSLGIHSIFHSIETSSLTLLLSIFDIPSRARSFYAFMLERHLRGQYSESDDLVARCLKICSKRDIPLLMCIFHEDVEVNILRTSKEMESLNVAIPTVDSIKYVMDCDYPSRETLQLLLRAF